MMLAVECSEPFLPNDKPRYAMGARHATAAARVDRPRASICSIASCRRVWRATGTAFTASGTLNLKNAEFTLQMRPDRGRLRLPGLPRIQPRLPIGT